MKKYAIQVCILLSIVCWVACNPKTSKSIRKIGKKTGFITGKVIYEDDTYNSLSGGINKLQAMLGGKYALYQKAAQDSVYRPWSVNDNKDSIVQYSIPVGDPRKNGYILYHYQTMTSLPDEPISEVFEELTILDRDSIKSIVRPAPKSFNVPLERLIKEHRKAFAELNMDSLKSMPIQKEGIYVRKELLLYVKTTPVSKLPDVKSAEGLNYYYQDSYHISPKGIYQQFDFFLDSLGTQLLTNYKYDYRKRAMVW